jgi:murein DD-endopeptidase MepM/ murein hydrolase activator NlpD
MSTQSKENALSQYITPGLAMFAGAALGAAAMSGLHAQGRASGAYVILDISEITDAKPVQSIEEREIVSPSRPVVPEAAASPAPVTISSNVPPKFTWPVRGRVVLEFCYCSDRHYDGINIAAPEGTVVKAAADGTVIYAGDELRGYGNLVLIRHSNGWITAYAYNSKTLVKRGDEVQQGQSIAVVGRVAAMTFPQLHFEIGRGGEPLDPLAYLPKWHGLRNPSDLTDAE